jgi:hypothetical protein
MWTHAAHGVSGRSVRAGRCAVVCLCPSGRLFHAAVSVLDWSVAPALVPLELKGATPGGQALSPTRWCVVSAYRNPGAPSHSRWINPEWEVKPVPGLIEPSLGPAGLKDHTY